MGRKNLWQIGSLENNGYLIVTGFRLGIKTQFIVFLEKHSARLLNYNSIV